MITKTLGIAETGRHSKRNPILLQVHHHTMYAVFDPSLGHVACVVLVNLKQKVPYVQLMMLLGFKVKSNNWCLWAGGLRFSVALQSEQAHFQLRTGEQPLGPTRLWAGGIWMCGEGEKWQSPSHQQSFNAFHSVETAYLVVIFAFINHSLLKGPCTSLD